MVDAAFEGQHPGQPAPAEPEILRVPGWERYAWLRAGFSTRRGGKSQRYGRDELNLGWATDDDASVIAANRAAFVRAVAGEAALDLVTVSQVHGSRVRALEQEAEPFTAPEGKALLEGDGLLSRTPGRLLAVLTADCTPILIADTRTHAVAALHAGWRGTLAGIVGAGLDQMREVAGADPGDLIAAIGPCIGACCLEVGEEVRVAFGAAYPYAGELFTEHPGREARPHLDLVRANLQQLLDAGVPQSNISLLGLCTACSSDGPQRRFFSYRAEGGRTGRMLSAIGAVA